MLDHVTLSVADRVRSCAFYDAALAPLGLARLWAEGDSAAGYGRGETACFWIVEQARSPGQVHVAFAAPDRAAVAAFHAAALAHGGRDNGAPGLRPHYDAGYFAAFTLDPDGNNIEAVAR